VTAVSAQDEQEARHDRDHRDDERHERHKRREHERQHEERAHAADDALGEQAQAAALPARVGERAEAAQVDGRPSDRRAAQRCPNRPQGIGVPPSTSRVAAIPSRSGIRTSIRTTSGRRALAAATAVRPFPASPTTSTAGSLRSSDAGASWRPVIVAPILAGSEPAFRGVARLDAYPGPFAAVTPSEAVFLGQCPACDPQHVMVLRTEDGGTRWQRHVIGGFVPTGLAFADADHGWMTTQLGGYPGRHSAILATTDGGRTWHPVYPA
jgi:hypothetical protein